MKLIKVFTIGLILLFLYGLLLPSCNNRATKQNEGPEQTAKSIVDTFSYELFNVGKGYGFDIFKNGKVYIHQPMVPAWEGLQVFTSKESAGAIASLIEQKLSGKKFRFLLEKAEVDSIMKKYVVAGRNLINIKENTIKVVAEDGYSKKIDKVQFTFPDRFPALNNFPVKGKWYSKGTVPFGARASAISFTIKNRIFIGGGEQKDLKARDLWCYNVDFDFWTCMAEFPGEKRMGGVGFSLYNLGYWSLGQIQKASSGAFCKDLYEYNAFENTWARKEDFPGDARTDAAVFVVNNKAYLGLGYAKGFTNDMYEYDPARENKWRRISDFAGGPVSASIGIGLPGKGFIIAGDRASNNQKSVYEYLPVKDKWLKLEDLPGAARYFPSGCIIDTNLFLAGCGCADGGEVIFRDLYVFDAANNKWSSAENYPISRKGIARAISANVNGKVFLGTGHNGNYLNDWNVFEYYFSVRTSLGDYNESIYYPLQYTGQWELFQECSNENCYAGAELKSREQLGNFYYSSRYVQGMRSISLNGDPRKTLLLFPRNFAIRTDKQPRQPVSLRLIFTRKELEKAVSDCYKKTGVINTLNDVQVLQCNESNPDTDPSNSGFKKNNYSLIKPNWRSYGFNGETLVAEFPVASLRSEFYIVILPK